jgi:hypothetical protein
MQLIVRPPRKRYPSQDAVDEFDAAIAADPRVDVAPWEGPLMRAAFLAGSALFKAGGRRGLGAVPAVPRVLARADRQYFAVLMGPQFAKCLPHFMLPATKGVYLFDVWPGVREDVVAFVEAFSVDHVFVSASQSAAWLRERVGAEVHWMPEGIDPAPYQRRPLDERDVDVLQLGRKYDAYHERIVGPLAAAGRTYLYEKTKGEVVFPSREGFLDGLARSKVSVCVPSSVTHPARSGDVETMTLRYLQSMASKCLVVGHAPDEMVRLFGYNPVVEIDMADPAGQLLDVLDHADRYADLVERNYRNVLGGHTWRHRWAAIAEVFLDVA